MSQKTRYALDALRDAHRRIRGYSEATAAGNLTGVGPDYWAGLAAAEEILDDLIAETGYDEAEDERLANAIAGRLVGRVPELIEGLRGIVLRQIEESRSGDTVHEPSAAAAEREACAKVAEGMHLPPGTREEIAADIAAAIRARKP